MIALVLAVVLVILAHEMAHGLLLRRAGAHPFPVARAWGVKGIGWGFYPEGIALGKLRLQWVAGPLVELAGWGTCAVVIPWARPVFVLLCVVCLAGNSLPGGDLQRAVRYRQGRA
ncbi:MAG: hypothetical protein ACYDD0_00825 [Candidatus Dormibacteria bacterium]